PDARPSFGTRSMQVGCSRLAQSRSPISGEPEIGGPLLRMRSEFVQLPQKRSRRNNLRPHPEEGAKRPSRTMAASRKGRELYALSGNRELVYNFSKAPIWGSRGMLTKESSSAGDL